MGTDRSGDREDFRKDLTVVIPYIREKSREGMYLTSQKMKKKFRYPAKTPLNIYQHYGDAWLMLIYYHYVVPELSVFCTGCPWVQQNASKYNPLHLAEEHVLNRR